MVKIGQISAYTVDNSSKLLEKYGFRKIMSSKDFLTLDLKNLSGFGSALIIAQARSKDWSNNDEKDLERCIEKAGLFAIVYFFTDTNSRKDLKHYEAIQRLLGSRCSYEKFLSSNFRQILEYKLEEIKQKGEMR